MIALVTALLALTPGQAAATDPTVEIAYDFVDAFHSEFVTNAEQASARGDERSGKLPLPGLFVHPRGVDDAVVIYPDIAVPDTPDPVFLLVRLGMRDGIPWDEGGANGVRFSLFVNGEKVLDEVRTVSRWAARAIDLAPWKGTQVSIAFHTNAIDGNTAYDWSVWGDPVLAVIHNPAPSPPEGAQGNGVLLVQLEAAQAVDVTVKVGEKGTRVEMQPGTQWVPVHFDTYEEPALQLSGGAVAERQRIVAFHTPELRVESLEPSTSLVHLIEPFNIILTLRNVGRGTWMNQDIFLRDFIDPAELAPFGDNAAKPLSMTEPLLPNEERQVHWDNLQIPREGVYPLGDTVTLTAAASPPPLPPDRPLGPQTALDTASGRDLAIAANPWSRLAFVSGGMAGTEYWMAETWNGQAWQRMGTLCPWVEVIVESPAATPESLAFRVRQLGHSDDVLYIVADATDSAGRPWQLRCESTPAPEAARIHMRYHLHAPEGAEVLAFYGPSVAAGDKSFGINKEFAIFPGLEYLEGPEESSSTRDLAYPLNDRRVPSIHKIASPVMAVQGQGGLIALLWDPLQEWAPGEPYPAARFNAPTQQSGYGAATMALFAPAVGTYVPENNYVAEAPYRVKAGGETLSLECWLVLDHTANYDPDSVVRGPHTGGLVLQAMQHYFEAYGMPLPSEPPRDWEAEKALCRDAYLHAVWHPEFPGWSHCEGWKPGDFVGHTIPLTLDLRDGVPQEEGVVLRKDIAAVLDHAIQTHGPQYLWSGAGCHIMLGEVPFYYGHLAEAMTAFRDHGLRMIAGRDKGLWVWQPGDEKRAALGVPGDHTLGQAALPSYQALRSARFTGDETLSKQLIEAMKQMDLYQVPRGAQTWECPLYQPDILAAAEAIRAYTEAYRLTGDPAHLANARYWAWSGLPFLYTWELPDYPTMRYNVISVIGSTFYTHSWIGLPVVWCGLVYAYALQDLAEFDDSFDWKTVAQGITNSAMWQQYTEGPSRGTYPDSWNMVENHPNPADINPENILVNAFRLQGLSPEIRYARFDGPTGSVMLNSSADILESAGTPGTGTTTLSLLGSDGTTAYSLMAPVPEPSSSNLTRVSDAAALQVAVQGWHYHEPLRAIVFKTQHTGQAVAVGFDWEGAAP